MTKRILGKPLRILVVEDSEDDATLLIHQLKQGGFDPTWERVDSLEAMEEALSQQAWDIAISDHTMPQFSATKVLELIRRRNLDIPVIILSGTIQEEKAIAAMREGASDFIMKGNAARLLPAIERELREAATRRKARQLEEQFRRAQKMEAIGRLAGGVAHDFNNLLTAIDGSCHFLLSGLRSADPRRADVEDIRKAAERAASLTRQLLAFSRQQVLDLRVFSLNETISGVGKMLRRLIGEDIVLETSLSPDLRRVKADSGQIEQVIMNLVVNARDAMPEGGKVTIQTSNTELGVDFLKTPLKIKPGPYVLLSVTDTGTGMSPEVQSRIFEPFFTTKEQGKGTGLGLAIIYGIVEQSGGFITVFSELGHGTSFNVYLPPAVEAAIARRPAPAVGAMQGSETVLVVEDDAMVLRLILRTLRELGYRVLAANSPEEALRRAESHKGKIHLLLTDVVLPQMHGPALYNRLSQLKAGLRVLYMSGYTGESGVLQELISRGAPFLQKPMSPNTLSQEVREVLDTVA